MEGKMKEAESTPDFILELLIAMVEWGEKTNAVDKGKRSIGITLNVGGLLVSGELISTKRYMDEFLGGALRDKLKTVLEEHEDLRQLIETAPETKDMFVHLRDAKFLLPRQRPIPTVGEGVLWRGPVDSVDGFFVGRLDVSES